MKFLDRKNLNKVILGVITVVVTVIAVTVSYTHLTLPTKAEV